MKKNKIVLFISLFMPFSAAFAESSPASSPLSSMLMFGVIIVMMYFMMIRPQSKRAKEHKKLISELAIGDEVLTNGGVLGVVSKVTDNFLKITIADGVEITVQRQAIANALPKGTLKSIK
jgi:preprotein translocase subunit YajC